MSNQWRKRARKVPLSDVDTDKYQRPFREDNPAVQSQAKGEFSAEKAGRIEVSHRGGVYYVFDGQHRVEAARRDGLKHLDGDVYEGMTIAEEAELFGTRNEDRKSPTAADKYISARYAEKPWALDIDRILGRHGLRIARGNGGDRVQAVAAVRSLYDGRKRTGGAIPGRELLDQVIGVIRAAWPDDPDALQSGILYGVGIAIQRSGDSLDVERLIKRLQVIPGGPCGLIAKGRAWKDLHSTSMNEGVANAIAHHYNQRLRSPAHRMEWVDR